MEKISRRDFVKNAIRASSGVAVLGVYSSLPSPCKYENDITNSVKVFIPMPIQVVIDDVGWWSGEDGSKRQEPYRTGIDRNHVPADYQAIANLGKALGIRPQAAFVLCEWDKENILRKLPTSTWMGVNWNNSKWIGPWMEEAAEIIRNNKDYFELTIHGIGHEYWKDGTFTRAEWTDSKGQMRPEDQVELHLEYFAKLMDQHNLGSLPESFVPCAFRHSFGPSEGRKTSLAELLTKHGISYINTPFEIMYNKERVQYGLFGFDRDVMTIDRGSDEFPWLTFPANPSKKLSGPSCGMHWPNMLHPDPSRNQEAVDKWVSYLKFYNDKQDMMLAPDSVSFRHQLAHNILTKTKLDGNLISLDFSETDKLPGKTGKSELTLKIMTDKPHQFKPEGITMLSRSLSEGSECLYILKLKRDPQYVRARIIIS